MKMAESIKFNISGTGSDGFYCLTYGGKIMGRFRTHKQASAHKEALLKTMTIDGNCIRNQPRGTQ